MSYAANAEMPRQPGWGDRHGPYNNGFPRFHPAWIVVMVLGFIAWWPVGLGVLAFILWRKNMGCWSRGRAERWQHKMDRMRSRMEGEFFGQRSSGNHAFDEYRMETLRRLEDEQREFKDFLERLRFAKDKTEFDQFMSERRNRPPAAPTSESPQPQA